MNILISNDDGILSKGLIELAKRLSKKHNILVVAPDGNRSGYSHSLSFYKNISINKVDFVNDINAYTTSGTPADCVKFAKHILAKEFPIDLIVSGVNIGNNLGTDVLYSGTVSVAIEGAMHGYKSIAFSSCGDENADFSMCAEIADKLIDILYPITETEFIWNVNIPALLKNEIKGYKVTKLGVQIYSDNYKKLKNNEYILVGKPEINKDNPTDCDVELSRNGYITITPILYNKTDYTALEKFKGLKFDE